MLNLNTLKIGDVVGIARSGSWDILSEGLYTVLKVDKVKVIVKRESDGYERTFNIKSGNEKGCSSFRSAFLETAAEQVARNEIQTAARNIAAAWCALEKAASAKSVEKAEAALAVIKSLQGERA